MSQKTYRSIRKEAIEARKEGIDIICLPNPEYTETLNCLREQLKYHYWHPAKNPGLSKNSFRFRGITYILQE